MARALWTGALTFGLVNVPVRLYGATSRKELRFHLLHAKDDGRVHYQRVCSVDGAVVPYEELVKGYEISRGQFVRVDPDELAKLLPRATRAIEIEAFVALSEIDPIYFETTYHVAPDKGAGRAFALLREAMERRQKVGIARMVLRTKQSLCAVRPGGSSLLLSTMLYADEVTGAEELGLTAEPATVRPRELELAEQLVEALSTRWTPQQYRDEYREEVLALIRRKAEGEQIVAPPEEVPARVVDLADALAASLEASRTRRGPRAERRAPAEARAVAKRAVAKRRKPS